MWECYIIKDAPERYLCAMYSEEDDTRGEVMDRYQTFIAQMAAYIKAHAPKYDIQVVSAIIAQAIIESAWGTSNKAKYHNYFGLKWRNGRCKISNEYFEDGSAEQRPDGTYYNIVDRWCKFKNMEEGVIGYLQWIDTPNYQNLKGITDPRTYLETIKRDGYATSLNYVQNVMAVVEKYDLTRYDKKKEVKPVGYVMKTNYALRANYGNMRDLRDIHYIVIHYTANDGDTDEGNANYFKGNLVQASAHYFVDDDSVTQSVPDNYVAWSVGGAKWTDCSKTGGGNYYGICTNANSVSIEICDTRKDGKVYPTQKTIDNAVALTKQLMKKYNIGVNRVIRHFDVNGKHCPVYWMDNNKWREEFWRLLLDTHKEPSVGTTLYKVQCGAFKVKLNAQLMAARLSKSGIQTALVYDKSNKLYKVQCGAFSVRANAEAMKTKVMQLGFAAVVTL